MREFPRAFARVYNKRWGWFAESLAPHLHELHTRHSAETTKTLLDVCCGTGQLGLFFAERGYHVTGVDNSQAMLEQARRNLSELDCSGHARFIQAEAADFAVEGTFGLAVATGEALNHLPDAKAVVRCVASMVRSLEPGGLLVVDVRTRHGFSTWNHSSVEEFTDGVVLKSGLYTGGDRAYQRVAGYHRDDSEQERYTRFEQIVENVAFDVSWLVQAIHDAGATRARVASVPRLETECIDGPEQHERVAVIASGVASSV